MLIVQSVVSIKIQEFKILLQFLELLSFAFLWFISGIFL